MPVTAESLRTLVAGAAGGIGRATALRLARRGDRLILVDRDAAGLASLAEEIKNLDLAGGTVTTHVTDLADPDAVAALGDAVRAEAPFLNYLFHCAGVVRRRPVTEMALEDWETVLRVHLSGTAWTCQTFFPLLLAASAGSAAVLTSSDFGVVGMRGSANYAAAKTGIYALAKSLALEFAPRGLRVNAIGPGPIDTPLLRSGRSPEEWSQQQRRLVAGVPLGRLGLPDEVAAVVLFLLSERSRHITGQLIQPNGGQVMW